MRLLGPFNQRCLGVFFLQAEDGIRGLIVTGVQTCALPISLAIAERFLEDKEDLIHKATGWMLREVGKRDQAIADSFLMKHCQNMPRVMLRYAIEKLPAERRKRYLDGTARL